jgi:hypothetical protein
MSKILKTFDRILKRESSPYKFASHCWCFINEHTIYTPYLQALHVRIEALTAFVDDAPCSSWLIDAPAAALAAGSVHWNGTTLQAGATVLRTSEHNEATVPRSLQGTEVELSADALTRVLAARDTERSSVVLSGVDIDPVNGSICCTDGKILLSEPIPGNTDAPRTIMRYELARAVADFRRAGAANCCTLITEEVMHEVRMHGPEGERITLHAQMIEGVYPQWRGAVGTTPGNAVTLPKALLQEAIKLQACKHAYGNSLVISVTAGLVRLHSWQGASMPWAIEYQLSDVDAHLPPIGLCVEYLRRVIAQSGDTVEIAESGLGKGVLIDRHQAGDRLAMPVTLSESAAPQAEYTPWTPPHTGRKPRKCKPCKADMLEALDAGRLDELRAMIRQL